MADFTESAKGLAKNPLGIIALFISFVYALACVVIGASASTLDFWERIPLIYFVILFPVLTLGCFTFLVVKHHRKLYAPKDYTKEEYFMTESSIVSNELASTPSEHSAGQESSTGNIKALLLNASFYGSTILYTLHLSKKYNRPFTLESVLYYCSYLEVQYSFGFIVAARSIGAIMYNIDEKGSDVAKYNILSTYLDPDIDSAIEEQIYDFADDFPTMPYLKDQLNNLKTAFSQLPTHANSSTTKSTTSSQTPPSEAE